MRNKPAQAVHLIVNWKSSRDFAINSIAAHSLILHNGSEYVWYGKMVKSAPVKIPAQFYRQIERQLKDGAPTYLHLYSPDYKDQNIWHIGRITKIQTVHPREVELIPPHYGKIRYPVSYWFKVTDFREFTRGEIISNLIDVLSQRPFDLVSAQQYPLLVHERDGLDEVFNYQDTNGRKWFEIQKLYCDKLRQQTKPRFVFVIMPFATEFNDVYKLGIKRAVSSLTDLKLTVERADETLRNKAIIKRIREKIREADLIIADVTGNNPNVLYELGYADALEKTTVILTRNRKTIPFDLNEKPNIQYNPGDTATLKKELAKHIRAYYNT